MAPTTYTAAEVTECLMALISWSGNATAAVRALEAEGTRCPTAGTLRDWSVRLYADRFDELSDKYKEQLEEQLATKFRFAAGRAVELELAAIDRAMERLEQGKDQDPSRTAANAATVADKMTGKLLALTGRPTSIREDRKVDEIVRSLVSMGVLEVPGQPSQIEASTGGDDA